MKFLGKWVVKGLIAIGLLRLVALWSMLFVGRGKHDKWLHTITSAVGVSGVSSSQRQFFSQLAKLRKVDLVSRWRLSLGARPHYDYIVLHAAKLAARLGYAHVTVIEFGVAGGNGILYLESISDEVLELTGVKVHIVGFDSGGGLPPPKDYRDMPYRFTETAYQMDQEMLFGRIRGAKILLGLVENTLDGFDGLGDDKPIGAVIFDFDYYSSTMEAFRLFSKRHQILLPRIQCYFDDINGSWVSAYSEFTGELAAIADFNASAPDAHISYARTMLSLPHRFPWHHQIYVAHLTDHPEYGTYIKKQIPQLPLDPQHSGA